MATSWIVTFGKPVRVYRARHLAEQFARALRLNESRTIESPNMYSAVQMFAGVRCLKLTGDPALSTKSNPVRFIAEDGSAREFTAYEVHE